MSDSEERYVASEAPLPLGRAGSGVADEGAARSHEHGHHQEHPDDAHLLDDDHESAQAGEGDHRHGTDWLDLARVGLVALGAALVWFRVWEPFPHLSIIGLLVIAVGGWPIFRERSRISSSGG